MLTHSGSQYHPREPISEIDPNIANITKLLEDLSGRLGNIEHELKSNRDQDCREC